MTKVVILRPRADRDVDEIFAFLRADSPKLAVRFREAIERVVRLLGEHPAIGSTRHAEICPELPRPLRFHPLTDFPRILVYYMDGADSVEVIRIWDSARGLSDLRVEEPRAAYKAVREIGPRSSALKKAANSKGVAGPTEATTWPPAKGLQVRSPGGE